ncbi:hypothetical protein BDZ45DRAFT_775883 [Acephala macrosclerotiorum]|nr:hypothetical protein BDZ45DRAFT_775883 [Acephala macrosclerotiorum]
MVIVGFSAVGITTFVCNIADYDEKKRICHIGLTRPIVITMLIWDVFVNFFLTAVFLKRCRPYMVKGHHSTFITPAVRGTLKKSTFFQYAIAADPEQNSVGISQKGLLKVIRKAVWGYFELLPPTIANFSLLIFFQGPEEAWFFFTICILDVNVIEAVIEARVSRVSSFQKQVLLRPVASREPATHFVVACRTILSL